MTTVTVYEITVLSEDAPDPTIVPTIERILEEGDVVSVVALSTADVPAVRPSTAMPLRGTVPDTADEWLDRVNLDGSLKDGDQ